MQECQSSHRTCRSLAEKLARNGVDVLRFDYLGTGDSAGESTEISIVGAAGDTVVAIDELRDIAQVREVTLIGLRLGAAIAAHAAARQSVKGLVLWDPVSDGRGFKQALEAKATQVLTAEGGLEVEGFPFPARLQHELTRLSPTSFGPAPSRVMLVVSEDLEGHRRLANELSASGTEVELTILPNPPCWTKQTDLGVGAIPADIIRAIAGWTP